MKKYMYLCIGFLSFILSNCVMATDFLNITDPANGQGNNYTQDLLIQTDGKALVAGYYYDVFMNKNVSFVLRYTSEGQLDSTFGTDGINMIESLSGGEFSTLDKLGVLSDGKIILAGQIPQNQKQQLLLLRLNTNGTVDTDFGTNGFIFTELTDIYPNVAHLTIQKDDSFFVTLNNKRAISILKFNEDGSLNTNFANGGMLISNITGGNGSFSTSMAVQNDGKLIVVGGGLKDGVKVGVVARYEATGIIDNSFGADGVVIYYDFDKKKAYFNDISIQDDGKIVVTGTSIDDRNNKKTMLLLRFLSDGNLDTEFANEGLINTCLTYTAYDCNGISLHIKDDGNILVGSQLILKNSAFPLLYQFDSNGQLDSNYGIDGSKLFGRVSYNFNLTANGLDNEGNDIVSGFALIDGLFKVILTSQ